ncbi:MAG: roadblock/LC7 domain-containing protein [Thermodesulfobacteriota bacterium]
MGIRELLNRVMERCEGSLTCIVCGFDGVVVESVVSREGTEIEELGAEAAVFSEQASRILDSLAFGALQECHLMGDRYSVLVQRINSEYFLILVFRSEAYLGRARHALKVVLPEIAREL